MKKAFNILNMRTDVKDESHIIETMKTKYDGKICPVNDIIQSVTLAHSNKDDINQNFFVQ